MLKSIEIRRALAHATPRERIISEVLSGEGNAQHGPIPSSFLPGDASATTYEYDLEASRTILTDAGWQDTNGDSIREKGGTELSFTLTTSDVPELAQTASILKDEWEAIGVRVHLDIVPTATIQQQNIRTREYQALLFGEVLGLTLDPFAFWHSSQVKDPGLNLSLFQSSKADEFLESARQELDEARRLQKYVEFQQLLSNELPAIFLYNPHYMYALPKSIKGFETAVIGHPAERFLHIANWYVQTSRKRSSE